MPRASAAAQSRSQAADRGASRTGRGRDSRKSPLRRGWTRPRWAVHHRTVGFPAHAGMDPCTAIRSTRTIRLPRTRGDGPTSPGWTFTGIGASPHTRGWTLCALLRRLELNGFPAHTGMDRDMTSDAGSALWLPRTRGDGPAASRPRAALPSASPHTRGWTLVGRLDDRSDQGFPAHAGMDPLRTRRCAT